MSEDTKNGYHLLSTYYVPGTFYSLHNLILIILQDFLLLFEFDR